MQIAGLFLRVLLPLALVVATFFYWLYARRLWLLFVLGVFLIWLAVGSSPYWNNMNQFAGLIQATIYTAQTIALLGVLLLTIQQIAELRRQTADLRTSIQGQTLQRIVQDQREVMIPVLQDQELQETLFGSTRIVQGKLTAKQRIFLTFLINHAYHAFRQHELGVIPEEIWTGMVRDMRESMFSIPAVQQHWKQNKASYSPSFQSLVNAMVCETLGRKGGPTQ